MTPKYAIIIINGGADDPHEALANRTPLEAAATPVLDEIAASGRRGTVRTIPDGFVPGSDVAALSLLGYDPVKYYTGRAPIEAVARNIRLGPDDVAFRCNLVTVVDGEMVDHAAGHIRTAEAAQIIDALNAEFDGDDVRFHTGLSYRNLMIIRDPGMLDLATIPPHAIFGERVDGYRLKGRGAGRLNAIIDRADAVVAAHEVNLVRRDLGETPASAVWLWSPGVTPIMRRFRQRFGLRAAAVGAVDLMRGLAKLLGLSWIEVPGATGDLDTDYLAKGGAAGEALADHDLVVVHIEAAGEAGHAGDVEAKSAALERIDADIVRPVLDRLRTYDDWRILVAVDHPTPCARRTITETAPPFCMAGFGVSRGVGPPRFHERAAEASDLRIERGCDLMEYFLRR